MKQTHFNLHFKTYVICAICGQFFVRKIEFLTHYFNHVIKRSQIKFQVNTTNKIIYKERKCTLSKKSKTKERREVQKESPHGTCKLCGKFYKCLDNHLTHGACNILFKCEICSNVYTRRYKSRHMLFHTNPNQSQCKICLKVLSSKYNLEYHKRTHTLPNIFECELCPRTFTSIKGFKKHIFAHKKKLIEETTKQRLTNMATPIEYKCENCFIKFKTKEIYDKHLTLNRLEKSFNCEICSGLFTLKCHSFIHSKSKIPILYTNVSE
ncbi:unnamed protein product [Psylliodes chrysocephalus]|uniref:C2H2-type domain-containing protein n=1 Tax=Psylliodes chrysocephalus TaxID=3402493 RepID=A0A9P0D4Y8_9CUCU|nr:unnamed protein product [Psylliodes chrysocephala]